MDYSFFTTVDYIYICILLLSTVIGIVRGFTKDILSNLSWILSAFVATFASQYLHPLFAKYFISKQLIHCFSFTLAYVTSLVVCLVAASTLSRKIKNTSLSSADRAMGAIFGVLRGGAIIVLIYIVLIVLQVPQSSCRMLRDAKLAYPMMLCANSIAPVIEKNGLINQELKKSISNVKSGSGLGRKSSEMREQLNDLCIQTIIKKDLTRKDSILAKQINSAKEIRIKKRVMKDIVQKYDVHDDEDE